MKQLGFNFGIDAAVVGDFYLSNGAAMTNVVLKDALVLKHGAILKISHNCHDLFNFMLPNAFPNAFSNRVSIDRIEIRKESKTYTFAFSKRAKADVGEESYDGGLNWTKIIQLRCKDIKCSETIKG